MATEKSDRIVLALKTALERVKQLPSWEINDGEKIRCRIRLATAIKLLSLPNSVGDVETLWLWPYTRIGPEIKVESFLQQPRFETLGSLVEVDFAEINSVLDGLGLKITDDLRIFYEVYQELLAEETRTAK